MWAILAAFGLSAQTDPIESAVQSLQRGDANSAETTLRAELRVHPRNPDALGVLAVVLDQEKKYDEAGEMYRRAIAITPRSAPLLNNYGNHLLTTGKLDAARDVFRKVIAIDPGHANALLQLARLAVERKAPAEALRHLERLPSAAREQKDVEITRMQALFELHRDPEAEDILARLSTMAGADASANLALGTALAAAGQYAKAEDHLSRALEAAPDNFDILYRLGLAAAHAGHDQRARDILESAHRRQPENVDVLYDLAAVNARLGQKETAVQLLAEAARIAPDRADVQELLARTTADLGYFGDAIQAWDRYLKLAPKDDVARRERAFDLSAIGQDTEHALADLKAFAARHPSDAVGRYELGIAEAATAPDEAVREFDRALALEPDLTAVRIARGLIQLKQGNFAAALPDFEAAVKSEPDNPVVLDRLGQTYVALDRLPDAVAVLRKAAEIAPRDSKILMHYGRALTDSGQPQQAAAVFARFRELGPDQSAKPHPAGLVDFLSLSTADQLARYRAGVLRTVEKSPNNVEAQVLYLKILLSDGKMDEAAATARRILALAPSPALLEEAGDALLDARQYGPARELLAKATSDPSPALRLNLAIATSHALNPGAGLQELDLVPQPQRDGDYYLARAQMLEASGRPDDAAAALNQALHANPTRADLYRDAVVFLIERGRAADALALLDRGARAAADNPEIQLARVAALEAAGKAPEAEKSLKNLENRWPDDDRVWLAQAIISAWSGRQKDAQHFVETAAALGAIDADKRYKRAVITRGDAPERALAMARGLFP